MGYMSIIQPLWESGNMLFLNSKKYRQFLQDCEKPCIKNAQETVIAGRKERT